ncbi:hypothetical protein NIES4071_40100 [Calothrix sp. NIES-4071]|nr:hypothetical protein NIES4071_40100 [Calothrix sp. NIES-4071]BAZ58328.1 hypothetical protein NIES4105_40040 [Calothrix sp. NIES-4105]
MARQVSDILYILLIPLSVWLIFNLAVGRMQAGRLLLTVPNRGRYIGQVLAFLAGILFVVSAAISMRSFVTDNNTNEAIAGVSRLLFGVYMLLNGFTYQPSVMENGIWLGNGVFVKWEKILFYEWSINPSQPDFDILAVRSSSRLAKRVSNLMVKSFQRQPVDDLLRQYVPTING